MRWRARLTPKDVGIVSLGRRRVAGLRREEVAELAQISVQWYTMLESGRGIRVSPRMLDRLAAALRLSDKEKIELFSLAMDELPPISHSIHFAAQAVIRKYSAASSLAMLDVPQPMCRRKRRDIFREQ